MFEKHLWKSDILSKDSGHWLDLFVKITKNDNFFIPSSVEF